MKPVTFVMEGGPVNKPLLSVGALVIVTMAWGSTFFIIKDAISIVDPADFLAARFTIAAILLVAVSWRRLLRLTWQQWGTGLGLGAIYGVGQVVQTIGLRHTDASVSGFITGTYVVITPLLLWVIFRRRVASRTWLSVGLAVAGLAVLSITGMSGGGVGELLTLLGAALYALHIVFLDRSAGRMDALSLTAVQLIGVAATCTAIALPGSTGTLPDMSAWGAILYTAVIAGALTMLLQTWAQGHLSPTKVAVVMTLEPVFATAFAVALGGETLTGRLLAGGALILAATVIGVLTGDAAHPPHVTDDPDDHRSPLGNESPETAHAAPTN
ncbi:DMT family transporter [Tessaracoccus antarcticus]|uniref:DMT family transporter n=1 Tax=Tessaracoccus antarcticus TaxID=2479848 RepID=A0A3M0G9L3_9ACTN|nr:DMT family transporter [Tessaracoccus antarcticus]